MPSTLPARFSATVSIETGRCVVAVSGELDLDTAPEFDRALISALEEHVAIVLDASACEFMDSTGLQRVLRLRETMRERGDRLIVVFAVEGPVGRLIALAAPGIFDEARTLDEARVALGEPPAALA